jgi:hypothetical protein
MTPEQREKIIYEAINDDTIDEPRPLAERVIDLTLAAVRAAVEKALVCIFVIEQHYSRPCELITTYEKDWCPNCRARKAIMKEVEGKQ